MVSSSNALNRGQFKSAVCLGDRTMYAKHVNSFDDVLIDDRNERPLTIALATIVMVWSMAFALTFASGHLSARSAHSLDSAAITSTTDK